MIWLGMASIGLAVATMTRLFPLPKVLITTEFFGGLFLIFFGYKRRREQRDRSQG